MSVARLTVRLPSQLARRAAAPSVIQSSPKSNYLQALGRRYISAYGYTQAKSLVFKEFGEPKDVLSLHKHSISPPHDTQCTVRLLCAPLNPADINQIQGVYPTKPHSTTSIGTPEPINIPGNEGAFEVVSTGSGVKSLKKGDWVIMKKSGQGTWRTHAQFEESQLMKVEDKTGLTPLQVGTVSVNPITAYRMIHDFCEWDWLRPGEEWIIQNGANSGVGRAAIQLAKQWNLKTLNVVRERKTEAETEEMKKELLELGATVVVTEAELLASGKMRERIKELTRGGKEPIRLALNCVGGQNGTALAKYLAPSSYHVTYGAMAKQPLSLPAGLLIFKDIKFQGFWVSRWSDQNPLLKQDTITDVLRMTREGKFKDIPVQQVEWEWETNGEELAGQVQGTLGGFRSGKGVLMYKGD